MTLQMVSCLSIFAQAAPAADIDFTVGKALAGLTVMSALVASFAMIMVWIMRLRRGDQIFPAANRKPLCVPLPLLICGILLSAGMAMLVYGQAEIGAEGAPGAIPAAPIDETESGDIEPVADDEADAADEDATAMEAEQGDGIAGDDAEAPTEVVNGPPVVTIPNFQEMVLSTIVMNGMIFLIFGMTILMVQQMHGRRLTSVNDVCYESRLAVAYPVGADLSPNNPRIEDPRFNPYTAPNPFGSDTIAFDNPELEVWNPVTELRFAVETFLAAYLPTAVLRIIILSFLPEAPSHPFLEMMDNGDLPWSMIFMIGLMAIVVAPIVEELLYRVTILGGLMQQRSVMLGWVLSSVLFGFAHGFPDSIALLPLAFIIGYTYIRRRSYRTVVLVHFLFNGFNMLVAGMAMF